jgi:hypothetical protein
MADVLSVDKRATIIGLLPEGSSIRSTERVTGVHRDTIISFWQPSPTRTPSRMNARMRNLPRQHLQF